MEPTTKTATCGHSYTRSSGRVARCDAPPHPAKPEAHYFVWDAEATARRLHPAARPHRSGLIVIPGERV